MLEVPTLLRAAARATGGDTLAEPLAPASYMTEGYLVHRNTV